MGALKVVGYLLAVALGLLGLIFVAGNQGEVLRIVVGVVLLAAAVGFVVAIRMRPQKVEVVQKIDLSGDVHAERLKCDKCGAALERSSVTVKAGAVFVACPYCEATYQLEEEPKW